MDVSKQQFTHLNERWLMGEQHAFLKPSAETSLPSSRFHAFQEHVSMSLRFLTQLKEALGRAQSSLEHQHKACFHTYITYQQRKQPYLALQNASECAQTRKLAQTIQKQQYRLGCLHQRILSASTEDEYIKLRTYTNLIIQTLQEHLETASPAIQHHLASLIEILAAQNNVDKPQVVHLKLLADLRLQVWIIDHIPQ